MNRFKDGGAEDDTVRLMTAAADLTVRSDALVGSYPVARITDPGLSRGKAGNVGSGGHSTGIGGGVGGIDSGDASPRRIRASIVEDKVFDGEDDDELFDASPVSGMKSGPRMSERGESGGKKVESQVGGPYTGLGEFFTWLCIGIVFLPGDLFHFRPNFPPSSPNLMKLWLI